MTSQREPEDALLLFQLGGGTTNASQRSSQMQRAIISQRRGKQSLADSLIDQVPP